MSRTRIALVLAIIALSTVFATSQQAPVPPVAERIDHKVVWHGETAVDPYHWLREKANPEVVKYLEAENAYTEAMARDLKPFQNALYKEMLGRIKQSDLSMPVRQGKYYYYSRTAADPSGTFKVVLPREKGHKYDPEHREGLFYIRTNKGAKNFRVVTAPVADPGPGNWKDFVPSKPDVLLEGLEVFKDYAVAHEKIKVPISIVYKKRVKRDGKADLWLCAYGSYGAGMSATFSSGRLSLLDRGVAYAIAHIRGGDEMGEAWHDDGMLMKKNTFNDFLDCAEYLITEKWTSKAGLMIEGGSAGGLLTTAVTNMRPDLFKAVHSAVPFADVINTMMDASLPLTVGEYLEWGNPNEKKAYDYTKSYSPYDSIEKGDDPAILVTTSFNDSQVMYWEPTIYAAKLRSLKTDKNELLLNCKMEPAGHGGASGRYDRLKGAAFETAWMLKQIGITK